MVNDDDYVDIYDPKFISSFNDRFSEFFLEHPNTHSEPCFDSTGRVKRRGSWDKGPIFSSQPATSFEFTKYQDVIRNFLTEQSPYRGVLLFAGLGSGKTASAIGVAEQMKHHRQIVVLTPASLKANFMSELKKCGGPEYHVSSELANGRTIEQENKKIDKKIQEKYTFVSYDAPNLNDQIESLPGQLNNKLLIVDEAHNLISMMASWSKKGSYVFFKIMQASNLKLLFLTGTPIINSPFEIGIIANLLTGYLDVKTLTRINDPGRRLDKDKRLMFQTEKEFFSYFVKDSDPPQMQNINALKNRLSGIVSFYAGAQPSSKILPEVHQHVMEIEMSDRQFELYDRAREIERDKEKRLRQQMRSKKSNRKLVDFSLMFNTTKSGPKLCNFRAFSRQFCNFAFPPGIPRWLPRLGDINSETFKVGDTDLTDDDMLNNVPEDVGKYTKDEVHLLQESMQMIEAQSQKFLVEELPQHSAKLHKMTALISSSPGPVYVYSQFRTIEGIGILSLILRAHGWLEYGWSDPFFKGVTPKPLPHTRDSRTGKRYGVCSASEKRSFVPLSFIQWPKSTPNNDKRDHLLNVYNSEENKFGHMIKAFLSTKSGAEGINLMNVRQVHIMEPYWNDMLIRQAIGRAVRICSHATLPAKDRRVDVYHYISKHDSQKSPDTSFTTNKQESTDQHVKNVARAKAELTDTLEHVLKEVAFDCRLNYNHNSLAATRPIKCFDFVQDNRKKTFALDMTQEQTDADVEHDTQMVTKRLIPFVVNPLGTVRFDEQDKSVLLRFLRGEFKPKEHRVIDLWHRVNPFIIASLQLNYPDKKNLIQHIKKTDVESANT